MRNQFNKNVGTKGPVYISALEGSTTAPVIFVIDNAFGSNSGIYGSATLYLRTQLNEKGECGSVLL